MLFVIVVLEFKCVVDLDFVVEVVEDKILLLMKLLLNVVVGYNIVFGVFVVFYVV